MDTTDRNPVSDAEHTTSSRFLYGSKTAELKVLTTVEGYLIFLGFCVVGLVMAWLSKTVRKHVHRDLGHLDSEFDAGGKVSCGLVASTIASQWTWSATLLQSTTVAAKYGISGSYWYSSAAVAQLLLFSMITIQLKIKAPGAKTFLQLIKARFGRKTHIIYSVFALLTNIIVTAMLMLGGAAVITTVIKGFSTELATLCVAAAIFSNTYMGGLGASLYMSYVNSAIMMIFILTFLIKIFYSEDDSSTPQIIGSVQAIYESLNHTSVNGNHAHSYLTIVSGKGLVFGVINLIGNFGAVFVDQSFWQCGVASKPKQGVIGILTGALVWFAVPLTFSTALGLGYLAITSRGEMPFLSEDQLSRGLVAPFVAQWSMGRSGEILILLMVILAVVSTGSMEVMAITSIIIYDIYQLYFKPYRVSTNDNKSCILCGKERGEVILAMDSCSCISKTYCQRCAFDDDVRLTWKRAVMPPYKCPIHGPYRTYNDYLLKNARWCQLWVIISIVPLTLLLEAISVSLGWLYLFMGVVISSVVIPITLTLYWDRLTSVAMIAGALGGFLMGLIIWLLVSATRPGGLKYFIVNTGADESMLAGNLTSILGGGIITVVVALFTSRKNDAERDDPWGIMADIDNPLRPWSEFYSMDVGLSHKHLLRERPSIDKMEIIFRRTKIATWVVALTLTFTLLILWPLCTVGAWDMNLAEFKAWITVITIYAFVATLLIIIMPIVTEFYSIQNALHERRSVTPHEGSLSCSNSTPSIDNNLPFVTKSSSLALKALITMKRNASVQNIPVPNLEEDGVKSSEKINCNEDVPNSNTTGDQAKC